MNKAIPQMSTCEVFERVARRELSPEVGAMILIVQNNERERLNAKRRRDAFWRGFWSSLSFDAYRIKK